MSKSSKIRSKKVDKWKKGFLDGLTCAVEILATTGNEGSAETLLKETNMGKAILENSKKENPELYKKVIKLISLNLNKRTK